jgi:SNF2 family DNA or RNA helicase
MPREEQSVLDEHRRDDASEEEGDAYHVPQALDDEEIKRQDAVDEFLDFHATEGLNYQEACRMLGIGDPATPYLPGTSPTWLLLPHQPVAIEWIISMLRSPLKSALIADTMGLGKAMKSICAMAHIKVLIERGDQFWLPRKPVLVIVPLDSLFQWRNAIKQVLPRSRLHEYSATKSFKLSRTRLSEIDNVDIVLTSYEILAKRHGLNAQKE